MTKTQIIQAYQKANTLAELEEQRVKYYGLYGKFLSWDLKPIKAVYDNKIKELK